MQEDETNSKQGNASASPASDGPGACALAIFGDVLCGVDGTKSSYEAVRQAASLAGPAGHMMMLAAEAFSGSGSAGGYHVETVGDSRASRTLEHAQELAAQAGVASDVELAVKGSPMSLTLERAAQHRLLALGAPSMSRLAHLLVGGVASRAAHELPCALLIARQPAEGARFDERILVASEGGERSDELVDFVGQLARTRDAALVLFHAAGAESSHHPTSIAAQAERLRAALDDRFELRVQAGRAHQEIVQAATEERATLIVLASRRVNGVRALGSVCERVVHDAPCSVLVLRPEDLLADAPPPLSAAGSQHGAE
ncbi:MAG TPA: universal stress protein [Solirubrobacteraceae bacterium]|nr:universal stress protein [Solirubrobacteraceae bacterium]